MKKHLFPLFAALVFFTGCDQNSPPAPTDGKALRIHLMHSPETFDPRKASSINDINLAKMFMEGLTRIGKTNKPELALAERYTTSEDKKNVSFCAKESKMVEWRAYYRSRFCLFMENGPRSRLSRTHDRAALRDQKWKKSKRGHSSCNYAGCKGA